MAVLRFKNFFNEFGCKILVYIQGFGRSMSIGTTCLLSVCQALTICLRNFIWKEYKVKVEKNIGCYIALFWIMYIFINFINFAYTLVNRNSKNVAIKGDFGFCCIEGKGVICDSLYAAFVVCSEVFFSVLMVWTSASMIVILYRHTQRIQHIHSTHGSRKNSSESRATRNILTLVITFLAFCTLSSILRGYVTLLYNHNWWPVNISRLASMCFPSLLSLIVTVLYPSFVQG